MKNNNANRNSIEPQALIWLAVVAGAIAIGTQILISTLTEIDPLYSGIAIALFFALGATAIIIKYRMTLHRYSKMHGRIIKNGEVMTALIEQSDIPSVITHDDGTIIWANRALKQLLATDDPDLFGKNMNRFFRFDVKSIKNATQSGTDFDSLSLARRISEGEEIPTPPENGSPYPTESRRANGHGGLEYIIDGKRFLAKSYTVTMPAETGDQLRHYNLTVFDESTELFDLKDKMSRENLIVAYIVLDNLSELAQYVRVNYRAAANSIEVILKDWAESIGGVISEYDRDKYVLFLTEETLAQNIIEGFPILDTIKKEKMGDNSMSITVSMGISGVGATVLEREQNAQIALDTALRRGGDQVVIKKESGMEFYGGRSKAIQKREKVSSRVIANRLSQIIKEHSSVMVMGHKNPDCDSLGSCIGIARFAKAVMGPDFPAYVVTNTDSDTFRACTAAFSSIPDYDRTFMSARDAIDFVTSETLLIIVDANNFNIIESSDIADSVSDIVIIDHHRKTAELPRSILLEYIDPSASSASELVTEMIESEFSETTLIKEEADVMLSGIMLDTMNFTRSTGMRTFSAAYFLRAAGAASERARAFFEDDITQHVAESKFFAPENVIIYRDNIAIAISMGTDERYDRVAASKAAERLITVKNVNAAFALVLIGETIHVSARSTGKINVQLILEKMGGGGHFDAAGAQVSGRNMNETLVILKSAINSYLDE